MPEPFMSPDTAVSDELLQEFVEAYMYEFNEKLSPKEALAMLTRLTEFYLLVSQPLPRKSANSENGSAPAPT